MSYIESKLVAGERIIYVTRYHWFTLVGHIFRVAFVLWILFTFVSLALSEFTSMSLVFPNQPSGSFALTDLAVFWTTMLATSCLTSLIAAAVLCIVPGLISIYSSEFGVTDRRVIIKVGLIARHTLELNLSKIESFQISESLFGRLFGYNNLTFIGSGGTRQTFRCIANGELLRDAVTRLSTVSETSNTERSRTKRKTSFADNFDLPSEPVSADAQIEQAVAYIRSGSLSQAREVVKYVLQQDDQNADAWYLVGYLSEDKARKRSAYQRALSINPHHAKARSALQTMR